MKPTIHLITFASVFMRQEEEAVRQAHHELLSALDEHFDVHIILKPQHEAFLQEDHSGQTVLLFIATGGTEGAVVASYDHLPKPLVLLTDGKANSLAASLELCCWIRQQKDECQLIHGHTDLVVEEINRLIQKPSEPLLKGERIGVIGQPSDWLVASGVDYTAARERWGVEYVDIPLSRVETYFKEETADLSADADAFIGRAEAMIEPTRPEVIEALRLYRALKRIATEDRLSALTLQCFSLIPTTGTTGCLALSLLNDEGIIAGCEGDLQSIFTLLLAKRATGVDGFMANPSRIDRQNNTIILAHCTIGLKQTERYIIRSHFESLSGVAIQGILPLGPVTIVKCGGADLSQSVVLSGQLLENQNDSQKCRTQLLIQLDSQSVDYFLTRNIGNHHIILQGYQRQKLQQVL